MRTIVISDLHLGSKYCRAGELLVFLGRLPSEATLVLNGDTIDRWQKNLPVDHARVLDWLRTQSRLRPIIWIRGNHDETYLMPDSADIDFRVEYAIDQRLYITHGHEFDNIMPRNPWFLHLFRALHHLRIKLGAESVHVARYAKKFPALYRVLRRHVALNAVEHARERGFAAATCGHTHFIEDSIIEGVRYLNTGSWTEAPVCYVDVDDTDVRLVCVGPEGAPSPR